MTLGPGDRVPDIPLTRMTGSGPAPITRAELFAGRTVALFAVPGAFTPACSDRHLPSIIANAAALRAGGADVIGCLLIRALRVRWDLECANCLVEFDARFTVDLGGAADHADD